MYQQVLKSIPSQMTSVGISLLVLQNLVAGMLFLFLLQFLVMLSLANSVILPGAILSEDVAVGACSLVKRVCDPWSIYVGTPARKLRDRGKELLSL